MDDVQDDTAPSSSLLQLMLMGAQAAVTVTRPDPRAVNHSRRYLTSLGALPLHKHFFMPTSDTSDKDKRDKTCSKLVWPPQTTAWPCLTLA